MVIISQSSAFTVLHSSCSSFLLHICFFSLSGKILFHTVGVSVFCIDSHVFISLKQSKRPVLHCWTEVVVLSTWVGCWKVMSGGYKTKYIITTIKNISTYWTVYTNTDIVGIGHYQPINILIRLYFIHRKCWIMNFMAFSIICTVM